MSQEQNKEDAVKLSSGTFDASTWGIATEKLSINDLNEVSEVKKEESYKDFKAEEKDICEITLNWINEDEVNEEEYMCYSSKEILIDAIARVDAIIEWDNLGVISPSNDVENKYITTKEDLGLSLPYNKIMGVFDEVNEVIEKECNKDFNEERKASCKLTLNWMNEASLHLNMKLLSTIDWNNFNDGENKYINSREYKEYVLLPSKIWEIINRAPEVKKEESYKDSKAEEKGICEITLNWISEYEVNEEEYMCYSSDYSDPSILNIAAGKIDASAIDWLHP